jgi:hypothetical protein
MLPSRGSVWLATIMCAPGQRRRASANLKVSRQSSPSEITVILRHRQIRIIFNKSDRRSYDRTSTQVTSMPPPMG